jgi:hypothetical protein
MTKTPKTTAEIDAIDTRDFATWMRLLISEKGTEPTSPVPAFESAGHIGLSYDHLIEFAAKNATADQQSAIRKNLVMLDVNNADVFDYLNHLMNGMIKALGLSAHGDFVPTKYGAAL